ncbi:MAG: hypothetical protein RL557_632 [archaeon]|jgi:glycosyltransferase involved in cell wall biosynthesis
MKYTLIIPLAPERDAPILECIKKLDYPRNKFHVVVIKGGNPSMNRNKGIAQARGEYVVFLDDDAIIKEDYLKKIDSFLETHPAIDVVGGPQLTPDEDDFFARISGYALSSRFGAWKLANRYDLMKEHLDADETALTSANLVCKKKVVDRVKFDETLFPGEDPKFIEDVKKAGFRVAYTPTFILYHKRRPTFRLLIKQIFNYGKVRPAKESFFQTLQKPFFLVPSLFCLYLVFLIGFAITRPSISGNVIGAVLNTNVLLIPLLAYLVLIVSFTLYDSLKHADARGIFVLPFLYPTIHISYGIGMLWGYVKKLF